MHRILKATPVTWQELRRSPSFVQFKKMANIENGGQDIHDIANWVVHIFPTLATVIV